MERSDSLAPLLLLGAAGITAATLFSGRAPAPSPVSQAPALAESRQETPAAPADFLLGVRPALEILAEHLGVPLDAGRRGVGARWIAEEMRARGPQEPKGVQDEADLLLVDAESALDKETDEETKATIRRLSMLSVPELKGPGNARRQELLDQHTRELETRALLAAVQRRLGLKTALPDEPGCVAGESPDAGPRPRRCPELRIVIATMPDYVDSYSAWTFDRNLDGIQRAAGAMSYTLDRFYLPDWDPDAPSGRLKGERHGVEPGAILYQRYFKGVRRLLLVLMPLETATAGVQKGAFLSAAALARQLTPGEPLRVLGPSFSGSSASLRLVVQEAFQKGLVLNKPSSVLIRSGSATGERNKRILGSRYCSSAEPGAPCTALIVDFQATTVSDGDTMRALEHFLGTIKKEWRDGSEVAILYEATTAFGQGFSGVDVGKDGSEPRASSGNNSRPTDVPPKAVPPAFRNAVRLAYPLHISRLRTQAREKAPARAVSTGGPGTVAFRLDDPAIPQDQLPAVRAEATAAVVQTTLATILDTLERSRVGAVGLLGTDDRDKIYLAEQIRYRCPNVQLFTIEGGLAFLHPQTRAFLRGAVVAASYPLFSATQLTTQAATQLAIPPAARRWVPQHQFQGVSAEGLYNALLTLVVYGALADEMPLRDRLLDYENADCESEPPEGGDRPSDYRCGPGVWISVVGHDAIWPIRRYGLTRANADYTLLPKSPPSDDSRTASAIPAHRLLPAAFRRDGQASQGGSAGGADAKKEQGPGHLRGEIPGAPRWPPSARLVAGLVAIAALLHVLGLLALAWMLGLGGRWRRNATIEAAGTWLEARLRRHAPWLEPPTRCAARWTPRAPRPEGDSHPALDPEEARRSTREAALWQEYGISLLACFGSLLAVVAWVTHLMAVWIDIAPSDEPSGVVTVVAGGRIVLGLAFLVAAFAMLWPTSARRKAGLGPLIAIRVVPVLMGLVTLVALDRFLAGEILSTRQAAFNVLRLAEVTSLVSPTVPVFALSAAVYLWGLWNLWRVHEQAVEFGPGASVLAVLREDQPIVAERFSRLLDAPELAIGLAATGVLGSVLFLEAAAAGALGFTMRSADGNEMATLMFWGTALVSFLVSHALAHGFRQGRTLLQGLHSLSVAPIGPAFAGLGAQHELWQLSAGIPRAREVHVLVQQMRATVAAFQEAREDALGPPVVVGPVVVEPAEPQPVVVEPVPARRKGEAGKGPGLALERRQGVNDSDRALARTLRVRPDDAVELWTGPPVAWIPRNEEEGQWPLHASPAWRAIARWSAHLVRVLSRGPWERRAWTATAPDPKKAQAAPADGAHFRAAETLLALQAAFSVRFALVRLMSVFALAVVGLLLLLAAHLFYAFQSRVFWLGVDWVLIGTATAIAVFFLVRLEKSTLLSLLWRSEPGKINWRDQMVHRILLYGAIPVVTLFVTFFPEVGAALFSWLEPVQKSLP